MECFSLQVLVRDYYFKTNDYIIVFIWKQPIFYLLDSSTVVNKSFKGCRWVILGETINIHLVFWYWDLNPQPLGWEYSALTTRPRLFALVQTGPTNLKY